MSNLQSKIYIIFSYRQYTQDLMLLSLCDDSSVTLTVVGLTDAKLIGLFPGSGFAVSYVENIFIFVIMRSLHEVHERNAYKADSVYPSVRKIQLENHWRELDEIWYGSCAIGNYTKIILLDFLPMVIN
jgi:hypothetical protein